MDANEVNLALDKLAEMSKRDMVPVALCRKLEKAIGAKWASGEWCRGGDRRWRLNESLDSTYIAVPAYTIGDLLAYCRSRKWGVDLCSRDDLHNPIPPTARVITLDDYEREAKTMPAALALAVLAASEK